MKFDDDGYFLECIRCTGSNSAVNGWVDLVNFVASQRGDRRAMLGLMVALRSLSQECQRQYSKLNEIQRGRETHDTR